MNKGCWCSAMLGLQRRPFTRWNFTCSLKLFKNSTHCRWRNMQIPSNLSLMNTVFEHFNDFSHISWQTEARFPVFTSVYHEYCFCSKPWLQSHVNISYSRHLFYPFPTFSFFECVADLKFKYGCMLVDEINPKSFNHNVWNEKKSV